jgi:hypothetical protein
MMQRIAVYLAQDIPIEEIAELLNYPLDALASLVDTPMMLRAVQQLKDAGEMGVDTFMESTSTLTFEWSDPQDDDPDEECD